MDDSQLDAAGLVAPCHAEVCPDHTAQAFAARPARTHLMSIHDSAIVLPDGTASPSLRGGIWGRRVDQRLGRDGLSPPIALRRRFGRFITIDDRLHQRVPDDVRSVQKRRPDAGNVLEPLDRVGKTAPGRQREGRPA